MASLSEMRVGADAKFFGADITCAGAKLAVAARIPATRKERNLVAGELGHMYIKISVGLKA